MAEDPNGSGDVDPSQRLLAEERERREKAEARLATAERLATIGTLAAGVAHEINNPLTWVVSNLEQIVAALDGGTVSRLELLTLAREAAQGVERIQSIVDGLRTFVHGEDDEREPVRVDEALDLALRVAAGELRGRARLVRRYGDVPPVLADGGRLSQVFLNLIINAVQAFGPSRDNTIQLVSFLDGDDVVVEVRDNGPGIPHEYISRLFDPFFTTKPVGVGSGLGLSICLNIVRSLDGSIDIDTEVGRGTTFRVRLPRAPLTAAPPEGRRTRHTMPTLPRSSGDHAPTGEPQHTSAAGLKDTAPPLDGGPTETPRRARVLLVDDEPNVLHALERVLRRHHEVVSTRSGNEAVGLLKAGLRVDAIVTDLRMADGSGAELASWLQVEAPDLADRLLFLTGGGLGAEESAYLNKPGRRWISKPVRATVLLAVVAELVSDEENEAPRPD